MAANPVMLSRETNGKTGFPLLRFRGAPLSIEAGPVVGLAMAPWSPEICCGSKRTLEGVPLPSKEWVTKRGTFSTRFVTI